MMIFSQRYVRAIEDGRLTVGLPEAVRSKLWAVMARYNAEFYVQRDPNDRWTDRTSIIEEVAHDLQYEHGWSALPGTSADGTYEAVGEFLRKADGPYVLDALELMYRMAEAPQNEEFRQRLNQIMELHGCQWRLSDGEFFKLDADFVGERIAASAHEALAANQFAGAADEYAKARREQASGDIKDAIFQAGKSFESVLKVLTGLEHVNADKLTQEFLSQGYLEDLPESVRQGFVSQVLKALPFLRNKLGGHGQGAEVLEVPQVYGELAIQLAGAFHNFFVAKHLEKKPVEPEPPSQAPVPEHDELPF
ncbi:AbiJ-NTD4 domain-containing protein [Magnetospirillum sp. 64-120]|uniref:AbiJ-NTD4 domain-containing protein n=1 Tax=Magnetospirillum sp. 64-120 TaxID=1895778 RepID=UPI0009299F74|nr:hypothetical protein [Magnetospirillum sp. 64-120]OJX68453.1 MAG: hypothetical protein BGO92_18665 [Magnetospirillum sp. 64-120]